MGVSTFEDAKKLAVETASNTSNAYAMAKVLGGHLKYHKKTADQEEKIGVSLGDPDIPKLKLSGPQYEKTEKQERNKDGKLVTVSGFRYAPAGL